MSRSRVLKGVFAPVLTPFTADLTKPDMNRFIKHCRWLLKHKMNLALFGTTAEGTSLSLKEKLLLLNGLANAGDIDMGRVMPDVGGCALPPTLELTRVAMKAGCGAVLVLPPFYYKPPLVTDEGLFRYYAWLIEEVNDPNLRIFLYHIPPVTHIGFSVKLVERLKKGFGEVIAGIKDSAQDWRYTEELIKCVGSDTFQVLAGNETLLLKTMRAGGAGCISATANVNADLQKMLYENWQSPEAPQLQKRLDDMRRGFASYPMIAAMKEVQATYRGDFGYKWLRPPLLPLSDAEASVLLKHLKQINFRHEGFPPLAERE